MLLRVAHEVDAFHSEAGKSAWILEPACPNRLYGSIRAVTARNCATAICC